MPNCCSRVSRTTRSTWSVRHAAIINGKPISEMRFDADHFLIDWEHQQATCPEGHVSSSWTRAIDNRTNEVIKLKFSTKDCQACPSLRLCTQSLRHVRRTVTIRPKEQYEALQARRQQESTKDFKTLYATRAGV